VIICQCTGVCDHSVGRVVAAGARSLAQVCRATKAGQDCGLCVFSVRSVMTEFLHSAAGGAPEACAA
jgi:bacterioferritin-associated ferredoxin